MPKGYLIVTVLVAATDEAVSGASVTVTGENYEERFTTDKNGKTPVIELDAPSREYSLTPQSEVRPYSVYSVKVEGAGFEATVVNGVQIFDGETSLQNIYLVPITESDVKVLASNSNEEVNVVDIPPHSLWEISKDNNVSNSDTSNLRVYPKILVPEYVIVHNGSPTEVNVTNYYVPFKDYIKNVASSEIYSTWPVESIKANVYAIISFTMNRIFTEWYKSRGFDFTITASPKYDHTYINNRTLFKSISDVVDQIFNYYILIPGRNYPFLAQYNDGIQVNNPGWLSQWGSKSLADRGYNALNILRYYYVNNLTLQTAESNVGLPTSFPGYNLLLGSCGEAVKNMQTMINAISNNYPAITKITPVDGQFNLNTVNSVKIFQQVFNLPVTGIVNFDTWYQISYVYVAVTKMQQGV